MISIDLPLPPRQLSPNSRGATRWRSSYVKAYREESLEHLQIAICEQNLNILEMPWLAAIAQDTFFWARRGRRDLRNAEAMLKPAYDAFVRGGLLCDDSVDNLMHLPTIFEYDKENPRVRIDLVRVPCGKLPRIRASDFRPGGTGFTILENFLQHTS